jgi:hypothetical protein
LTDSLDRNPRKDEDSPLRSFTADLHAIRDEFDSLDMTLNANRIARYEMSAATKILYAYAEGGDPALVDLASRRLRRARSMAPLPLRRACDPRIVSLQRDAYLLSEADRSSLTREWTRLFGRSSAPAKSQPSAGPESDAIDLFGDEIERASGMLHRLSIGLERWPWAASAGGPEKVRWPISNEAHVQSLLWLALAPALPGLKYEETLPSIGRVHPRADLALPGSGLVIEVKFIRRNVDFARVTEEIAADASLYVTAKAATYSRMLVFVWDNSRSSERHLHFVEGLCEFRGVLDAVIVSRPASMTT